MSYMVRRGCPDTADGFPRFGIEAVVSRDHNRSWNLDYRYILKLWQGNRKKARAWWASSQSTSSALMPDGWILTASAPALMAGRIPGACPTRSTSVSSAGAWMRADCTLTRPITDAPFDLDARKKYAYNLGEVEREAGRSEKRNIAAIEVGFTIRSSGTRNDPEFLLHHPYYYYLGDVLTNIPGLVEIGWPEEDTIDENRIHLDEPMLSAGLPERTPLDYRLQHLEKGKWEDLFPPVTNASGIRKARPGLPPEKRETLLNKIEVFETQVTGSTREWR